MSKKREQIKRRRQVTKTRRGSTVGRIQAGRPPVAKKEDKLKAVRNLDCRGHRPRRARRPSSACTFLPWYGPRSRPLAERACLSGAIQTATPAAGETVQPKSGASRPP
jgi:hypothetical protein